MLLLAFFLFVLPEWITLNRLIPFFSERLQQAIGRPFSVDEIRVSFLTGSEIRLRSVVIGAEGEARPIAEVREIRIGFRLLPLLWKRMEIVEIHLIEPTVSLIRDRNGEWNFKDLLPKREREAGKGWKVANRSRIVTLRQGRLSLLDHALSGGPLEWTAQRIEARIRRPFWDGKVDVKIDVPSVWQGILVDKATHLQVDGSVEEEGGFLGFTRETAHFIVTLIRFDSDLIQPYLSEAVPSFLFEWGWVTIDAPSADLFRLHRLFRSPETHLAGESKQISVTLSKDLPPVAVNQALWRYDRREGHIALYHTHFLDSTLTKTTGLLKPFTEGRLEIQTSGEVSLSDAAEIAYKRFGNERLKRLQTGGFVETDLKIKIPLKAPSQTEFHGRLLVRDGTLTPFSAFRPVQKIKGTVRVEGKELLIENAEGEWGTGRLVGTGKIPDLYKEGIEFDLHATTLDWEALRLPPDAVEAARAGDRPKEPRPTSPEPDQDDHEASGYAVGLLRIDHLKINEYDFLNWQSAMIYREKTLQFRETEADFAGGVFRADFAQVYFRPDGSVALALTPKLEQISVAAFLSDFRGDGERPIMSGRGLMAGGLNTEGNNLQEFKKNLEGNLIVYLEKGTIYRFRALARIFALMNLRSLPDPDVKGIKYDVLSGNLSIKRGKVALHDTVLFGKDVRVIANGKIDLVKNEFDLLMGVQVFRLVDDILKQLPVAGPILLGKDQMFIASYFEVEGKLTDPRVRFRPFKSIKESTLAVLRRALTYPVRPEEFSG
ncbi:MAG: AsmA-like C-terminal domain-containing protein [Candidatus Manganitrophus sp.]|nr:AsmA-like C-terminal domain-containing protein [Candidatus Manganitrophus sp.]MDC4224679.1 AsmA-like C-terminal domain-containing protein [Candidatus Manganitrophus sp.]WDT70272.1 MAG: AsmA-like C-terminal domain-containing protein [Candidatus Manganitrophus sp.]WDT78072.1 MAG: AsmA-like C-terminal domain-containing protein [Candidatus Manganitrophus sp.]